MIANSLNANRGKTARIKLRELERPGWIPMVITESRQIAQTLQEYSHTELQQHTQRLCRHVKSDPTCDDTLILILAAGAVLEAFRRALAVDLFDVQLRAGVIISCGAIAEMQTGEGKTYSAALPAYFRALAKRGVHVVTPNHYLAQRDFEKLTPVFRLLGLSTGLLQDNATPDQCRAAYQADITYGPAHAFGFDYLRDQLTIDRTQSAALGSRVYAELCGAKSEPLLQRGLSAAIIDEIDHVLIDDAVSPLVLSGAADGESPDAEVHQAARIFTDRLAASIDFRVTNAGHIELTNAGFEKVYSNTAMTVHPELVRPWHEYVVAALRARYLFRRDVNYIVREHRVQIVETSTGRIFADRSWSDGIHQAVEAKEGLRISRENIPLARITRQRFYRSYQSLAGMTGTATGCEHEFASVYGLPVAAVPLRLPSKRSLLPDRVCLTRHEKLAAVADETAALYKRGRAVLIGTLSIADSVDVAQQLTARGLDFQLLNGVQNATEASVIQQAGQPGAITVATNLAGRGTDIALAPEVAAEGGLHVIVFDSHLYSRVDRQLIGRSARCGDPGTARRFFSADDTLLQDQASWLARAIQRWDRDGRRGKLQITNRLARIQAEQQRRATSLRWQLLQADHEDAKLFSDPSSPPEGCWQL